MPWASPRIATPFLTHRVCNTCACACVCLSVQAHNFFQPLERALHPPQATEDDEPVLAPTGRRRSRAPREGSKKRTKSSRRLTRATASSRSMGKGSNRGDRDASRDRRDASADPDGAGAGGGAATDPHIAELARQVKSLRPTTSVLRMVARDIVAPVVTDAMITANQIAVRCGAAPSQSLGQQLTVHVVVWITPGTTCGVAARYEPLGPGTYVWMCSLVAPSA